MKRDGQLTIAIILIGVGAVFLIANFLNYEIGAIFWPVILVAFGLVLIFRPARVSGVFRPFGLERFGTWKAETEDYWMFVGDVDLDYHDAQLEDGNTGLNIGGFVVDAELRVPSEVGVRLSSHAFVTDSNLNGDKTDHIGSGVTYVSPNYESATKKLDFELSAFVVSLKLRHS